MKHRNKISTFSYDQANMVYCLSHLMAIFVTIVNIMRKIFRQNSFFLKEKLLDHIGASWATSLDDASLDD